jgi:F-type H+-transporting ATPase subunit b
MQSLDIISVNLWQMLVSLANLIVLFLIVKKFLYKPVKKMLAARQSSIDSDYGAAKEALEKANSDKKAYEEKLQSAKSEADKVIKNAVELANEREKEIIAQAKEKADGIVRRAENEATLERKKAEADIRKEIVEVSSLLTEKMLEREVSAEDHERFIDSFIEGIGDENAAD